MRKIGSNRVPYLACVQVREWGCVHPHEWPTPFGRHNAACLSTLAWSAPVPVKAFKRLDAANAWVRSVRNYWLALTWPAPQILAWQVVDARSGTIRDQPPPDGKGASNGKQHEDEGRLF